MAIILGVPASSVAVAEKIDVRPPVVVTIIATIITVATIHVPRATGYEARQNRQKRDYDDKLHIREEAGCLAHTNLPIVEKSTGRLVFILADFSPPALASAMG
jgi:hypothetical protein